MLPQYRALRGRAAVGRTIAPARVMSLDDTLHARRRQLVRFGRSVIAGAAATLADLGTLGVAIGLVGLSARQANLPALLVGATVQFIGNRQFAFESRGCVKRQVL